MVQSIGESRSKRWGLLRALALVLAFAAVALPVAPAMAQQFVTSLVDIHQGSPQSDIASSLAEGGYELQKGAWVSLAKWYHTDWPEVQVDLLTQYAEDSGIIWGFGTGEQGEKYRIDPSLKLGFITQIHPKPTSTLALTASTTLWGHFTEFPCEADYGELGTFTVNCRLAAGEKSPDETLKYLVNSDPARLHVSLSFSASF